MNRRLAILTAVAILALGGAGAMLSPDPVAARTRLVTKRYALDVSCTGAYADGTCVPKEERPATTSKVLRVEFVANPAHCTPIAVQFRAVTPDGAADPTGWYVVAPGQSTGVVNLGPVAKRGAGQVEVWARDAPGGSGACADGPLKAWEGTLKVTTSKRVRR